MSGVAARALRRGDRARRADRTLDRRLAALADAAELARGRLDDAAVEAARAVVDRAGQRLGRGVEATVIAFAGPTGAGKSTLFNALAGSELAAPGHRRPTTSAATAAVWGDVGDALLDWLEVPRRHRMGAGPLDGLVLLDLPDFDSVVLEHRVEVERVIGLADLIVWVVDPQKYADAVLHERYLRRFAAYRESMLVVLNQADRLPPPDLDACRADLGRLLERDGLPHMPVLALSARTGEGIERLRAALAERVALREAASTRLAADVSTAAAALATGCDGEAEGSIGRADRAALVGALEEAAGVPAVVRAVQRAHRRRGTLATGWPYARWALRLRPDPLRRLRLPDVADADRPVDRASLPAPTPVQDAQVAAGTRAVAARAAGGLPDPWPGLVRAAAVAREDELRDRLEAAVAGTDLGMRAPHWWRAAGFLQRALAAVALVGVAWLAVLAGLGYLRLDDVVPTPELEGVAVPTLLLAAGGAGGLLLALLARLANAVGARRRARAAAGALRSRVATVGDELVLQPVQRELDVRRRLCAAVLAADE